MREIKVMAGNIDSIDNEWWHHTQIQLSIEDIDMVKALQRTILSNIALQFIDATKY